MASYGIIQQLLANEYDAFDEKVLIESRFDETTRKGIFLRPVHIGLTPSKLVIATNKDDQFTYYDSDNHKSNDTYNSCPILNNIELSYLLPLESVRLSVFKRSERQALKANIFNTKCRYFELGSNNKRKIFWKLWCQHVVELNEDVKLWPFGASTGMKSALWDTIECTDLVNLQRRTCEKSEYSWTNKYVYLGSIRHAEDQDRPVPVPGLSLSDDDNCLLDKSTKLSGLNKSECWGSNKTDTTDFEITTYTGGPTSNVTYTSIMNTVLSGNNKTVESSKDIIKEIVANVVIKCFVPTINCSCFKGALP